MVFCTLVQNRNGNLNVPYLIENDGRVVVNWNWLDNNWNGNNPALRFATHFTSHPVLYGVEFLSVAHSIHQASFRLLQVFLKEQCTFYYQVSLFPKES